MADYFKAKGSVGRHVRKAGLFSSSLVVECFTLHGQSSRPKSFTFFFLQQKPLVDTRLDNFVGNLIVGDLVGRSEGSDLENSGTLVEGAEGASGIT